MKRLLHYIGKSIDRDWEGECRHEHYLTCELVSDETPFSRHEVEQMTDAYCNRCGKHIGNLWLVHPAKLLYHLDTAIHGKEKSHA